MVDNTVVGKPGGSGAATKEAKPRQAVGRTDAGETVSVGSTSDGGEIRINNDVIGIIAGQAASEVKGVTAMSGSIADGLAKRLTGRSMERGIRVEKDGEAVRIDIFVIVEYGASIRDVARKIQENVKTRVEQMTGQPVTGVNVTVQGIHFQREESAGSGATEGGRTPQAKQRDKGSEKKISG